MKTKVFYKSECLAFHKWCIWAQYLVSSTAQRLSLGQVHKDWPQGTDAAVCPPSEFLLKALAVAQGAVFQAPIPQASKMKL